MKKVKKGDNVVRISHGKDIIFEVTKIIKLHDGTKIAILKGITERIEVDSDIKDLVIIDKEIAQEKLNRFNQKLEKKIAENMKKAKETTILSSRLKNEISTGKILHLDGDRKYSEKSLRYYQKMGLKAIVKNIPESKQPKVVYNLLMIF